MPAPYSTEDYGSLEALTNFALINKPIGKMTGRKEGIDIINEVLEESIMAFPVSSFIISLYKQYQERGSLSKKQLQGLHSKATKSKEVNPAKLATLEAIINKMPTRDKSAPPPPKPMFEKDESLGKIIQDILDKYPAHKRVLFLKSKYDNNEPLSTTEIADLNRFKQVLK